MIAHSLCVLWVVLVFGREVWAAPETWFDPVLTETGNTSSAFGASVACSGVGAGGYSFIAVGAPEESSGDGRVHILNPDGLVQTIVAPVSRAGNFGYFVTFIPDINLDFHEELVVGEPNSSGISGSAHVFLSTANISAPYESVPCATQSGPASFGSYIHANSTSSVVISAPMFSTPSIQSYDITYGGPSSSCSFLVSSGYDSSGSLGSRYGQSFAEIDTGGPGVVVGAPGLSSDAGGIYKEETFDTATLEYSGSMGSNMGAAVAARYSSPLLAYSSPFGSGSVTVQGYIQGAFAGFFTVCGLSVPMSDVPPTAGQSLTHLGVEFKDFVGASVSGAVFGVYSTQASTGGSIALFGADMPVTCTGRYSINNCAFDPDQKQGVAIAGGPQCKTTGGSSIIVVGSPGYNGNSGRVDVYQEGTHLASARPCSEATSTPTPTPTPTFTPTPAQGVVDTPIPVDPTTSGLPAPEASVSGNSVTITAPQGVPSDRLQQLLQRRLRRWCRKLRKRCRYRASISYQFIVTGPSGASKKMTSFEFDALSKKAKRRQYNSRKNSITLRKLKPGSYTASYRFVFTVKDPKARLTGRLSAGSRFVVR